MPRPLFHGFVSLSPRTLASWMVPRATLTLWCACVSHVSARPAGAGEGESLPPVEAAKPMLRVEPIELRPNLLPNASFEEVEAGRPKSWAWDRRNTDAAMTVDESVAHSGRRSLRITNSTAFAPHVYGMFHLPGGEVECWMGLDRAVQDPPALKVETSLRRFLVTPVEVDGQLAAVESLRTRLRARVESLRAAGRDPAYPLVPQTILESFVGYGREDVAHGELARAYDAALQMQELAGQALRREFLPPVPRYQTLPRRPSFRLDGPSQLGTVRWPDGRVGARAAGRVSARPDRLRLCPLQPGSLCRVPRLDGRHRPRAGPRRARPREDHDARGPVAPPGRLPPRLADVKLLVLAGVSRMPRPAAASVGKFPAHVVLGCAPRHDEYGRPAHDPLATMAEPKPLKESSDAFELLRPRFTLAPLRPLATVRTVDGRPAWGVEYLSVRHKGRILVNLCNYLREPQRCRKMFEALRGLAEWTDGRAYYAGGNS